MLCIGRDLNPSHRPMDSAVGKVVPYRINIKVGSERET